MHASVRLFIGAGLLLLPSIAMAGDLQAGLDAYSVGDYETSMAECEPLAEEGVAAAQFCVGRLYANGFGVAMNDELALKWYGLAAEQGHSEAQYSLGLMYANGWGVPMNDAAAANWYRLAAEQGYIQAQTGLATLCKNGMGMERNVVEAYTWYHIAMELGDLNAKYKRDDLASELSTDEVVTARQNAETWLSEHPDIVDAAY